jgi:hypothetical protein
LAANQTPLAGKQTEMASHQTEFGGKQTEKPCQRTEISGNQTEMACLRVSSRFWPLAAASELAEGAGTIAAKPRR